MAVGGGSLGVLLLIDLTPQYLRMPGRFSSIQIVGNESWEQNLKCRVDRVFYFLFSDGEIINLPNHIFRQSINIKDLSVQ